MDNNDNSLAQEGISLETNSLDTSSSNDDVLNDLNDEETIDLFIEGIMEEKGANAPTAEISEDAKRSLKDKLLKEIDRSLIAELPDDKLEELSHMAIENGQIDPSLIADKIAEANLDITDIVGSTMAQFRELYLSDRLENKGSEE